MKRKRAADVGTASHTPSAESKAEKEEGARVRERERVRRSQGRMSARKTVMMTM